MEVIDPQEARNAQKSRLHKKTKWARSQRLISNASSCICSVFHVEQVGLAVMAWSLVRDFLAGIIAGTQWFL
jgi:hypothetical protein